MNFYIETYGCQMNEYDSLMMAKILRTAGYSETDNPENADIIIINTCSVREKPEHKVYSAAGKYNKIKQKTGGKLIISGCVAQQSGEKIVKDLSYVDAVIGPHNTQQILDILSEIETGKRPVRTEFYSSPKKRFKEKISPPLIQGLSAYVTIMEGCDNFCSYCIVPYVRGREISRPHEDILADIENLVNIGIKDITLLGQNVNSYGKKDNDEWSFEKLITEIGKIPEIKRFRFITSHPKDLSDEVISLFGKIKNLAPYLHLPLQSGSNAVLKKMNRKYSFEEYIEKVEKLRKVRPDIALSTDLIVGFPGETDEHFAETINAVKMIRYDNTFSFKYSTRPFTKAASYDNPVPEPIKQERLEKLQSIQKIITREKNEEKIGTIQEVLVEKISKKNDEELSGRTGCNRIVNFKGEKKLIGKIIKVKIVDAYQNSLKGEITE